MPTLFQLAGVTGQVSASADRLARIHNVAGDILYYKDAPDVDSGDDSLAAGESAIVAANTWLTSAGSSQVAVFEDVTPTVSGDRNDPESALSNLLGTLSDENVIEDATAEGSGE